MDVLQSGPSRQRQSPLQIDKEFTKELSLRQKCLNAIGLFRQTGEKYKISYLVPANDYMPMQMWHRVDIARHAATAGDQAKAAEGTPRKVRLSSKDRKNIQEYIQSEIDLKYGTKELRFDVTVRNAAVGRGISTERFDMQDDSAIERMAEWKAVRSVKNSINKKREAGFSIDKTEELKIIRKAKENLKLLKEARIATVRGPRLRVGTINIKKPLGARDEGYELEMPLTDFVKLLLGEPRRIDGLLDKKADKPVAGPAVAAPKPEPDMKGESKPAKGSPNQLPEKVGSSDGGNGTNTTVAGPGDPASKQGLDTTGDKKSEVASGTRISQEMASS